MIRSFRFSIAGMMVAVLVTGIGVAALRNPSGTWAAVMFLLTLGLLCLAVVGLGCRGRAERAWWLGVNLFGWGYMRWLNSVHSLGPLTLNLVKVVGPMFGIPADSFVSPSSRILQSEARSFLQVGHCLCTLLAAMLGGILARALFGGTVSQSGNTTGEPRPPVTESPRSWMRPATIGSVWFILVTSVAVFGSRMASGLWAGATYLLTWALICLAGVGALLGRGKRREIWLGAALFGASFMLMTFDRVSRNSQDWEQLPTVPFLNALQPWFASVVRGGPADSYGVAAANARILKALERPVPMRFPDTTLNDVLKFIEDATRGPDGSNIPIYVSPITLAEVEKNRFSKVSIDLERVPLKTGLRLCLKQLELKYDVRDGVLLIVYEEERLPLEQDPVLVVGQCLLALIAVALGGVLAPLVSDLRSGSAGSTSSRSQASSASM